MSTKLKLMIVLWIVCMGVFLSANGAVAAKPLAKITAFKGEVGVLSGTEFTQIKEKGFVLNDGDKIQTGNGEAEVTFDDGAVMKLNTFTSSMIQVREEESGWLFKTKTMARRLTVFVGKLWFSSGSSHVKNILQTPSAVCGLRGSVGEVGYDNVKSFLNMISGESEIIGEFIRGVFTNPGVDAALSNSVYAALRSANQAYNEAATQRGALEAQKAGLEAVKAAAEALKNNPDPAVAALANQVLNQTNTLIQQKQNQINETPAELERQPDLPVITLPETTMPTTTTTTTTTTTSATTTSSSSSTSTTHRSVSPGEVRP